MDTNKLMKRLSLYVLLILFTLQTPSQAEDITDFQIEGISVGDSLLDYMSAKDIKEMFILTKDHYKYLKKPHKFKEAYIVNPNFETYKAVSFFVKPDDKNYTIFSIRGIKSYVNNIDECLKKRDEVANEIKNIIPKFTKREQDVKSKLDKSGKSHSKILEFLFESGDLISIACNDWEEKLRIKNGWTEGLSVTVAKKDISIWFNNKK